jgi:hypothetical protein
VNVETAEQMLAKVRAFMARELDDDERALFIALLAPGVAQAYADREMETFGLVEWLPDRLPLALVDAIRNSGIRVQGLEA